MQAEVLKDLKKNYTAAKLDLFALKLAITGKLQFNGYNFSVAQVS